jgi:hypothetical protein
VPTVFGGAGADTIGVGTDSSAGPVILFGNAGDDILRVGTGGNATLDGGAGNDTLISSDGQGYAGTSGTTAVQQGDFLVGGAGKDVFGFAGTNKLGFIGGLKGDFGTTVTLGQGDAEQYVNSTAGTSGSGFFNNTFVDTISGFSSAEGDKLYFNTTFINVSGTASGTMFAIIPTGTTGLGDGVAVGGTNVSDGKGAPQILGAVGTATGGFSGTSFAAPPTFGSNANMFTYDQGAGALYYAPVAGKSQLVAIFDTKPTLASTDFVFGDFNIGGINTTLI